MSIIFDFKAIRQAASVLGIRTIGEEDRSLPVAVQEQPQPQQLPPVPQCAPWYVGGPTLPIPDHERRA